MNAADGAGMGIQSRAHTAESGIVACRPNLNRCAQTMSMEIRAFQPADETAVIALWRDCGLLRQWNDPALDIRRKLGLGADLFLVGVLERAIVASIMAGYEGHRGWLNYLAVAPDHRHRGLGRMLVAEAERRLGAAGCPKVNLQIRTSNYDAIEFYRRLGYSMDDVVSMGKRLVSDDTGA